MLTGIPLDRTPFDALPADAVLRIELTGLNVLTGAGSARADIFLGDTSANSFSAGDALVGGGAGTLVRRCACGLREASNLSHYQIVAYFIGE